MEDFGVASLILYAIAHFGFSPVILFLLGLSVVTYIGYIKAMVVYRKKKANEMRWYHYVYGIPVAIVFLPLDVIVNAVVGTVIFLELPREWLLTSRLDRHARNGHKFAQFICKYLLNPFDEGHCFGGVECA